jgi:hypothetical protein
VVVFAAVAFTVAVTVAVVTAVVVAATGIKSFSAANVASAIFIVAAFSAAAFS